VRIRVNPSGGSAALGHAEKSDTIAWPIDGLSGSRVAALINKKARYINILDVFKQKENIYLKKNQNKYDSQDVL
jgi:hypothetical protein